MAKKKEKVVSVKAPVVETPIVNEEKKVEVPKVEEKGITESKPVATGKFYVKVVAGGAVVIGKLGQVVSNPMPINKANRLADHMNNAR